MGKIIKSFSEYNSAPQVEESLTDKAQSFISMKIAKLKKEGYPDDQAAAIAYSMAKKRGFDVGKNPNEEAAAKSAEDLNEDGDRLERPLDAPYVVQMLMGYVQDLMKEDAELATELRQVARSVRAQYPNNRDISVDDVMDIAEEVGMEDDMLDKVKAEIRVVWEGA